MVVDRARASKSALWSALENGGLSLVSFASLIIYSRLLSPSDFGLFAMVLAVVELVGIISNMAFHDALVQRKDITERHFNTAFTASLVLSIILVASCWALGPAFSKITRDSRAGTLLSWMSLSFLFAGASSTLVARQRREFGFRILALRSLAGRLIGASVGLIFAFLGVGIWALVIQQVLMAVFGSAVLWLRSEQRPRLGFGALEFKQLTAFGAQSVSALFLNLAIKRAFVFFIGIFLGTSLAGYINLAFRTIDTFWSVSATALSQVTLPIMSSLQSDLPKLRRAYGEAVSLACAVLYPVFIGIGMVAPELIELLFGKVWVQSAQYTAYLSILIFFQAPRLFVSPILIALGRPYFDMIGYSLGLAWLLIGVFLTRLATPMIALVVWMSCEILYAPLFAAMLKRASDLNFADQFVQVRAPLLATILMICAVTSMRLMPLEHLQLTVRMAMLVAGGAIAYVGSLYLLDRSLVLSIAALGLGIVKKTSAPPIGKV